MTFVGRQHELAQLTDTTVSGSARLTVLHGRRRVGKTALVEEAFKDSLLWRFDGLEDQDTRAQIQHFENRLLAQSSHFAATYTPIESWEVALRELTRCIKALDEPVTIFFDEFQWMAEMRSYLVSLFKSHWDLALSKIPGLHCIVCGSVSSFIVRDVIRSKALYGRIDNEIALKPLSVAETFQLMNTKRPMSSSELLDTFMVFGGIPAYLTRLTSEQSLVQNLTAQAFSRNGFFFGEFERIFISHFGKNRAYKTIVLKLLNGPADATTLAAAAGASKGGGFNELLGDLELAGFIERYSPINRENSKLVRYRLHDEFLHFYAKFILPHKDAILSGQSLHILSLSGQQFSQWRGYAFERLCRRHYREIAEALKFSGISYRFGSWFTRATTKVGTSKEVDKDDRTIFGGGAQIDLLFDRADRVLTVCEAKCTSTLRCSELVRSIALKSEALRQNWPRHTLQFVLLVPDATSISADVRRVFSHVIPVIEHLTVGAEHRAVGR